MKILQVEDFFHPEAGYQINILSKYMTKMGHEVTIITSEMDKIPMSLTSFFGKDDIASKDEKYMKTYGVKIIRLPLLAFISGRAVFKGRALFRTIQNEKPDVVFIHGNDTLTGMQYLMKYKKLRYPLVMDSHMLAMASQNKLNKAFRRIYRYIFTPILIRENIPVIRTQDDSYVERCLGVPLLQAPWISVGSDTMIFHPDTKAKKTFREEHGIGEEAFVVLYAGKLNEEKGGKLLAEAFKKKFHTEKAVVLIVVGNTSGEYGKEIEAIFAESENRILRFPTQKYCDLPRYYQMADLSVFPRQCSLSFYDVQACGLPVVSEDNNINLERCSHHNGLNFKADDVNDFRKKIEYFINLSDTEYAEYANNAKNEVLDKYNYADIAKQYLEILQSAKLK